jgi:hypothetical protein
MNRTPWAVFARASRTGLRTRLKTLLLGTYTISCQGVNASSLLAEQMGLFGNWFVVTRIGGVLNMQSRAWDGSLLAFLNPCQVNIASKTTP